MAGRGFAIHGSYLGGWALPVGLAGIALALLVTELLRPIRTTRSLFVWLGLAAFLALVLIGAELLARRNVVEVTDDRIRWSFVHPPERGDERLAELLNVELWPHSGVRLVFKTGKTMVSLSDFPRSRMNRLVESLRSQGAAITQK